eukprot:20500-Heterococcus_DN1.PRE.5
MWYVRAFSAPILNLLLRGTLKRQMLNDVLHQLNTSALSCCNHNRNCQASCAASSTRRPASSQSPPSAPAMPAHQTATARHALAPALALLAIAALMEC